MCCAVYSGGAGRGQWVRERFGVNRALTGAGRASALAQTETDADAFEIGAAH